MISSYKNRRFGSMMGDGSPRVRSVNGKVSSAGPSNRQEARRLHLSGADGKYTRAPLLKARDGAFYGTASSGGDLGFGTLFRIGHQLSLRKTNSTVQLIG